MICNDKTDPLEQLHLRRWLYARTWSVGMELTHWTGSHVKRVSQSESTNLRGNCRDIFTSLASKHAVWDPMRHTSISPAGKSADSGTRLRTNTFGHATLAHAWDFARYCPGISCRIIKCSNTAQTTKCVFWIAYGYQTRERACWRVTFQHVKEQTDVCDS